MTSDLLLETDFATLPDLVRAYAAERPDDIAAADPMRRLSWSKLDAMMDRIAARLQADGFVKGDRTAIAGLNSVEQMAAILGTLRAGGVAGLITNSATGEQMAAMIADTGARHLFLDQAAAVSLEGHPVTATDRIAMDGSDAGVALDDWMAHFDIRCTDRHQASADTLATAELLLRLWPRIAAEGGRWRDLVRLAGRRRWLVRR